MASKFPSNIKTHIILSFSCYYLLFFMPSYNAENDTLLLGQVLRDGEHLDSANKIFRLKFFRPGTSDSKYLGIFYNTESMSSDTSSDDLEHPVWVANRDTPVPDVVVTLMIDTSDGLLKISYLEGNIIVSNSAPGAKNTSATILDNGNLVLRALNPDGQVTRTLWQSFDYPTDTLLPGMKLGINFRTGHKWFLTSWISNQVPASGSFVLGGDPNDLSQVMIWWKGNAYWRGGLLDEYKFNHTFSSNTHFDYLNFTYVSNENEKYWTYSIQNYIRWAKVSMLAHGRVETSTPFMSSTSPACLLSSKNPAPPGCLMEMLPECRKDKHDFLRKQCIIIGSGYKYDKNQNMSLFDYEVKCRQNCSCIAFAPLDNNGTGCEIYDKDIFFVPEDSKDEKYQRAGGHWDEKMVYLLDKGEEKWWAGVAAASGGILLTLIIVWCFRRIYSTEKGQYNEINDKIDEKMNEVQQFSLITLEMATDNFSTANKLGEGGFGSVYKGELPSRQEIAIKRLSQSSGQGLSEFKNEILLTAKLQHDNLVKLVGCCMQGQEKILVYEYMPNRSLDFFLFDSCRRVLLNWTSRMNIIEGVAQGLLYLHKYSRLRVIHRDLKASNILLDQNMTPKISDFGMARIFGKQESEANTNKIVGTYGYMSPEYAIKGAFSTKSDVFSFGVLLLETVSGKKNHACYHSKRPLNLIGLAWELWIEGKAMEFVDPTLDSCNHKNQIIQCINVGLLCVQDNATDRPSMTEVISMLTNEPLQLLPQPKQPAFFIGTSTRHDHEKEVASEKTCTNGLSISDMQLGR